MENSQGLAASARLLANISTAAASLKCCGLYCDCHLCRCSRCSAAELGALCRCAAELPLQRDQRCSLLPACSSHHGTSAAACFACLFTTLYDQDASSAKNCCVFSSVLSLFDMLLPAEAFHQKTFENAALLCCWLRTSIGTSSSCKRSLTTN